MPRAAQCRGRAGTPSGLLQAWRPRSRPTQAGSTIPAGSRGLLANLIARIRNLAATTRPHCVGTPGSLLAPLWSAEKRHMLPGGRQVEEFIKHFRRERAGVWVCEQPASLHLPQGRIEAKPDTRFVVGTKFMNVDVARLLDAEYSRQRSGA